jgi:long-chain acyl-CoA synthetase
LLSKYVKGLVVKPDTTLDELGLTSLGRIELMMALEDRAHVRLSETAVSEAHTVDDLRRLTEQAAETGGIPEETFAFPRWNGRSLVRLLRNVSQRTWILPLAHIFFRLQVEGRDRLRSLAGPVVFASNHQSHFDTPVILTALPNRWRRTIAVAMWKEYFDAYFVPERHSVPDRLTTSTIYYLVTCFFNAFPLPQTEPGTRQALRYMGDLVSKGSSILIFPEGSRTERGEINPFQPGIGLVASKLHLPSCRCGSKASNACCTTAGAGPGVDVCGSRSEPRWCSRATTMQRSRVGWRMPSSPYSPRRSRNGFVRPTQRRNGGPPC